jgi:hypothetical protein
MRQLNGLSHFFIHTKERRFVFCFVRRGIKTRKYEFEIGLFLLFVERNQYCVFKCRLFVL